VGNRLVETTHGERTDTTLATDAELLAAYEKHFGFRPDSLVRPGRP
jgi:N-hydroxyarylamine O-acetyltransferase